ncbi:hypothetical protein J8I29_14690 [Labrys sp. LIt4]|uniref:hypothetical protein n=1 Tax=Labrys TaxID=204476 RepID=UPI0011B27F5D|nr:MULTISPECIES: hypothetical protein [Labrys]MBP0580569.1 hypothetical protein [Labrys sp. LIt4]
MIKSVCAAAALALGLATSALAAPNGVVTRENQCSISRLQQMQLSVDGIRDPLRHEAAAEELGMAVALMRDNDPDGCMIHLSNAAEYVTP